MSSQVETKVCDLSGQEVLIAEIITEEELKEIKKKQKNRVPRERDLLWDNCEAITKINVNVYSTSRFAKEVHDLRKHGILPEQVLEFFEYYQTLWQCRNTPNPSMAFMKNHWGHFEDWKKNRSNKVKIMNRSIENLREAINLFPGDEEMIKRGQILAELFGSDPNITISIETAAIFLNRTRDIDIDILQVVISEWVGNGKRFPSVAEINKEAIIKAQGIVTQDKTCSIILDAMKHCRRADGAIRPVKFSNSLVNDVIQSIGWYILNQMSMQDARKQIIFHYHQQLKERINIHNARTKELVSATIPTTYLLDCGDINGSEAI